MHQIKIPCFKNDWYENARISSVTFTVPLTFRVCRSASWRQTGWQAWEVPSSEIHRLDITWRILWVYTQSDGKRWVPTNQRLERKVMAAASRVATSHEERFPSSPKHSCMINQKITVIIRAPHDLGSATLTGLQRSQQCKLHSFAAEANVVSISRTWVWV